MGSGTLAYCMAVLETSVHVECMQELCNKVHFCSFLLRGMTVSVVWKMKARRKTFYKRTRHFIFDRHTLLTDAHITGNVKGSLP